MASLKMFMSVLNLLSPNAVTNINTITMHSHGKTAVLFGGRECCEVMVKNLMHPKILLSQETIILNISPDPNASFFLFFL
jgi:hypothetical protein